MTDASLDELLSRCEGSVKQALVVAETGLATDLSMQEAVGDSSLRT